MAHKGHAAKKKKRCEQKRNTANKKETLQTKKKRCKQKRNAANKKCTLQIKKYAANKKSALHIKKSTLQVKTNVANKRCILQITEMLQTKTSAANKSKWLWATELGKTGVLGHLSLLYVIKQLNVLISDAYVAQCGERLPTEREVGSSMPGVEGKMFFLFSSFLYFFLVKKPFSER